MFLTVGVNKECDCRETDSKALWTVLTAVIGFISAVTFACFVPKKDKRSKGSALILVSIIALIISTALFISFVTVPAYNNMYNDSEPRFYSDDVTYKDENGNVVFGKYSLFNDFKYSDIPQEELEIFDIEITQ